MYPHHFANLMSMNFSTSIGDIDVQTSTQWAGPPPPPPPRPALWLPSSPGEFRLCFRTGNISVCNGCRNRFEKNSKPPDDVCVQHQEWRNFTSPTTNLPDSRFGNAYYHADSGQNVSVNSGPPFTHYL